VRREAGPPRGRSPPGGESDDDSKPIGRGSGEWFASFRGPIGYEVRDLSVTAADDVAFCGRWTIAHDHLSVPFEMKPPFEAALDLQPS
jgi:ketosteroid isomerase-like protein